MLDPIALLTLIEIEGLVPKLDVRSSESARRRLRAGFEKEPELERQANQAFNH